ncbi:MAG TPA: DUF4349 domain-containing protein [Methylotenera sp.]|nr:DUF4349 domain-containing protein [Methylotenera sp.]
MSGVSVPNTSFPGTNFLNKIVLMIFVALTMVACGQQQEATEASSAPAAVAESVKRAMPANDMASSKIAGGGEQSLTEFSEPATTDSAIKRFIAMRHSLTVETPASKMQAAFDATVAQCELLKCQILSANYNKETPYSPPSASLAVRVPPRSVEIFINGLAKSGEVLQHHRDSEDKTDAVIDAEARIKNLTELRDRLRVMLKDKSAKFRDIIEIERELANTQAQLDSINGVRKMLAQETELVAVNIEFTAAQSITEKGFFAPVAHALDNAGRVMMESLANVITFIMGALPWLLFGIPIIILVRKFWTKIKTKFM